jgi:probable F420-dependent oxidoreductase
MNPGLASGPFVAELAACAEESGFSAIYFTEHPIPGDDWLRWRGHDSLDPFLALAFAAAHTTRLRLLTNLTVLPYRNPFLVAKAVATLDRLSGGRTILGVGTGYLESEYAAVGVKFEERNLLFDESLAVCRQAWTGQSVSHLGAHFEASGNSSWPAPVQDPLPVWIGGNSRLTRRRVAAAAQGWIPMPNTRALASSRHTPPLETLEELAVMISDLRRDAELQGRTEAIDVMFMSLLPAAPDAPGWDPDRHLAEVADQEGAGVTWQAVNAGGSDGEAVLATVRRFGEEVIARTAPTTAGPGRDIAGPGPGPGPDLGPDLGPDPG